LPPVVGDVLLTFASVIATPTQAILTRVAHWPGGVWSFDPHPVWYVFSAIAGLLCVLPVSARVRCLAIAALLPLWCAPTRPPHGAWRVLRLDGGAATVALVVTRQHSLLFGTGDVHGTRGGRVESMIVPAARRIGFGEPALVIAGRIDADVAAGIGAVRVLLGARRISATPDREGRLPPPVEDCRSLGRWQWDGVAFEVLPGPPPAAACLLRVGGAGATLELSSARRSRAEQAGAEIIDGDARGLRRQSLRAGPGVWRRPPPDG
jgi:beta-lactamase superfamily II metal-dependent hydrolase